MTFLLPDVVGSTRSWETAPVAIGAALARHELIATAIVFRRGVMPRPRGDDGATAPLVAERLPQGARLSGSGR